MWYNKKQCYVNKKGAAMNQYIGQQFAALRYEKNILVVEETTSAGGYNPSLSRVSMVRKPNF